MTIKNMQDVLSNNGVTDLNWSDSMDLIWSDLTFNFYQEQALKTAIYPKELGVLYTVLGLAGECGEVSGKCSKLIRDNKITDMTTLTDEQRTMLRDELVDCVWFIAAALHELGFKFGDAAQANLDKLASRAQRGKISGSGDTR